MATTSSLNVIALISGGKDSFFSLLHCLRNGHKIVALANLYPSASPSARSDHVTAPPSGDGHGSDDPTTEDADLNSFMFQTVGHSIIPLYAAALKIPLYRQPIVGSAVQTSTSYRNPHAGEDAHDVDETESLIPLLRTILAEHPTANALAAGAILSTYQRTRIESVALRLHLVPFAYLWQFPSLPPATPDSLLVDIGAAGLDARIIKVASAGLSEAELWLNVASPTGRSRVGRAVRRFAEPGDGALLGEGGEFETIVLDGPPEVFLGRIVVPEAGWEIVREDGGVARVNVKEAWVEMKNRKASDETQKDSATIRVPDMLDAVFVAAMSFLENCFIGSTDTTVESLVEGTRALENSTDTDSMQTRRIKSSVDGDCGFKWTVVARGGFSDIEREVTDIITQVREFLAAKCLEINDITSTTVLLRSMNDFSAVNKTYSSLFSAPNPPARVTISVGSALPSPANLAIHFHLSPPSCSLHRTTLHVQSRSYWAPANIGPYSQAQSVPLSPPSLTSASLKLPSLVSIAGQIPLVPATMDVPKGTESGFSLHALLALQHLWRIATTMQVRWFTSTVAFLARDDLATVKRRAIISGRLWHYMHQQSIDEENDDEAETEQLDVWDLRHRKGFEKMGAQGTDMKLPDWEIVMHDESIADETKGSMSRMPPFWAAEVEALPRDCDIEWAPGIGITAGPVSISTQSTLGLRTHITTIALACTYTTIIFNHAKFSTSSLAQTSQHSTLCAAYIDASIQEVWDYAVESSFTQLVNQAVPCHSLWDGDGERLAAVLVFRQTVMA